MPLILSIDQSTSATKALLFSETGEILERASLEHAQLYPKPGWVEHDAEEIWQNTLAVVSKVLGSDAAKAGEVACVSIANQRETVVIFEKGTGRPLCKAMVWQCRRGVGYCDLAVADGFNEMVEERTGLKIDAYFSASKLKWAMRNNPEVAQMIASGEALVGTIDAYLVYRLTEGRTFATDTTNASRTLLFDIAKLDWDDELCRLWETPREALPEVRDSSARFGETTFDGLLQEPLPICGVMGDSQAALFAQGCYEPGTAKVTLGTGSSIMLNIGSELKRSDKGVVTSLAWTMGGVPTYAYEGIIISAASTLSWLKDQLGIFQSYSEMEPMAEELEDNGGVYLVPAFTGLGLPYWRADARASIVGLTSQSDRRHVVRAGQESIAYQICEALSVMQSEAGLRLKSLNADGGPTSNRFLMQFAADLCGVEIGIATTPECSPMGAMLSGLIGMGLLEKPSDFFLNRAAGVRFRPSMVDSEVEKLLGQWRDAVASVLTPRSPLAENFQNSEIEVVK
ncbi:FGGY-family carbohydrate kinase [Pelagicoccus albus]|uniref:Glycerol kinase GlpK n=1 Tax=Pelagicoccus albus TaxID=415222 RepID=A0A7X1B9D1_9BACT|nr:glycerol kinase GlpK [Pelagicoccus albus]MBC2608084.1 glycerol kinase GlpK [Pelagicoccus albus]